MQETVLDRIHGKRDRVAPTQPASATSVLRRLDGLTTFRRDLAAENPMIDIVQSRTLMLQNERVSERPEDSRIHIRLMNEYGGGLPLWPDDVDLDTDQLHLSEQLRSDLLAFSDRFSGPSEEREPVVIWQ